LWRERVIVRTGEVVRFDRFSDFVSTPPLEGLGADLATLKRMCADNSRVLDALDQVSIGRPGAREGEVRNSEGRNQHTEQDVRIITDIVSNNPKLERNEDHGNGRAYALRRLRNERPDLHARVLNEELTPHAAMLEAGFRKKTMTLPTEVPALAHALQRRLSPEEISDLIDHLK
jgi:hypothetical protein